MEAGTAVVDFVKSHTLWIGTVIVFIIVIMILLFSRSEPLQVSKKSPMDDPTENVESLINDILEAQDKM